MADLIHFDDREVRQMFKRLVRVMPEVMKIAAKEYTNNLAFEGKKESGDVLSSIYRPKNSSTKRYLERGISVKKAKSHKDGATLGVLEFGSPKRYTFNRQILARQETGGRVRQLLSKGTSYRQNMLTKGTKQQGKRLPRMAGKTGPSSKYKDKRRGMASSLKMARKRGMKYASTPYGLYRVTKIKAYKVAGYRKDKKITTPKKPFLREIVKKIEPKQRQLFDKSMRYALQKLGLPTM